MAKEKNNEVVNFEFFELTLNVSNSQIPIAELIEYLRNTDKLFKGVNQTLNEKYTIGYNSIAIEVIPFEEGSFRIPVWIKKNVKNPVLLTALGTVLGEIVTVLLKNELGIHEIQVNNDTVVVEDKKLLENKTTSDALSNIANLVLHNDSIRDISVTYEKSDGEKENVCITKKTLTKVAEYCLESEIANYLQTSVTLEIVSPVFSDGPSNWKVKYNAKVLSAKMMDADFLEIMGAKGIAFGKGDTIVADLETEIPDVVSGGRPRYNIKKVISYPHYTRISRMPAVQGELFDHTGDKD
jgi:hypothetical protein